MPEYTHTLIPHQVDFVPQPEQVSEFLGSLAKSGAAPLEPTITVATLSGKVRTVLNPFTGQTESYPMRSSKKVKDFVAITRALKGLDDYNVTVAGKGPPKVPPFEFDINGSYDFLVNCCCRAEIVSTSDWHDTGSSERKVEYFDHPCNAKDRLGIFHHPDTLEIIKVPKAGCARFWIEFEFGKMLFPHIEESLDLIEPLIVRTAETKFGIKFVQGCRWCA